MSKAVKGLFIFNVRVFPVSWKDKGLIIDSI